MTLVTGPPCGGKSAYVAEHAEAGDLVLCADLFAQQAGSPVTHNHLGRYYGRAERLYVAEAARVRKAGDVTAWVVRCAPTRADRGRLASLVGATRSVVLLPPLAVAHQRATDRDGRTAAATRRAITAWYRRYGLNRDDEVVST